MKLLVFGDPHLHSWSNFGIDSATGLSKRLVEQQRGTEQIVSIAIKEKVDGVLCLGDIIHSVGSVSTEVLNTAYLFFHSLKAAKIPTYFVPGNHDLNSRKNPKWYNYSCKVFEPTPAPSNIKVIGYHEAIDYENTKGFDVVAVHKTPVGARLNGYTFEQGFDWKTLAANNKLVVCGHIHQRQHLGPNFILVGSPWHLTFGDIGDRGVYLVETDTGAAEFKKLKYPEFITVENYSDVRDDGNYYRVNSSSVDIPVPTDSQITEHIKVQSSPVYIPERIKSTVFQEILEEWLALQGKSKYYLDALLDIVDDKFQLGKKLYRGKLHQVVIKDFLSIGEVSYTLENGFTLVLGSNDVFNSNGSGKSSLFEAIYWCLFGKTTKELTADDVIRNRPTQQSDCKVRLYFTSEDGSELCISRSRLEGIGIFKRTNELFHDICGDRKASDAQKLLEDILGFDEKLFRTSCYFSQENLLMLTSLSDTDRTKMITDLLGFESYNDLYTKADKKIKRKDDEISTLNLNISTERLQLANQQGKLDTYRESLKTVSSNLESVKRKLIDASEARNTLERDLKLFKTIEIPFRDFDAEEGVLNAERDSWSERLARHLVLVEQHFGLLQTKLAEYEGLKKNLQNTSTELLKVKKQLTAIQEAPEGVHCTTCGSIVSKEGKQVYTQLQETLYAEICVQEATYAEAVNVLGNSLVGLKAARVQQVEEKNRFESEINSITAKITKLAQARRLYTEEREKQSNQKTVLEGRVKAYSNIIQEYSESVQTIEKQYSSVQESILLTSTLVKQTTDSIQDLQGRVVKLQEEIDILDFWKVAFSPKGIRALLLDRFCNKFNRVVNDYLHEISNGNMGLNVTPISMTKSGEERNKISMTVYFRGYEVKYASLSGGEKRRVDCSLIFALSKYVEQEYDLGTQGLLGVLVLDEVFGGLDKAGEDTLVSLLEKESKHKAIFIIDHLLNLTGCADRVWTVGKVDDVSSLDTAFSV